MSSTSLVYSPLVEEESSVVGWSKSTIDYVRQHKTKTCSTIRGIARGLNKVLQKSDVEDIYMDIISYLYHCDDYNISKAYERSSNGAIVSLEGYVHSCIKFSVKRFVTENYKTEHCLVREYVKDDDGKEMSLFDTIPSTDAYEDFAALTYSLEDICKTYESQRYAFGPDIFQVWFVRLITMLYHKDDKFKDILSVIGVTKKEMMQVEKMSLNEGAMMSIAKAVTIVDLEQAIEIIKQYVYSADRIEAVVKLF